ncbi:ATP-binding cassette sub-family A member 3-like [Trichechus manatus latirostris]|uniref:ATP-binding cassette sub-family A member 3-like n=1 Tax=Trichechus manatus latirostris TaxID=127582 RepID=A0A2Y9QRT1_TRIMA|nr:ATP-binding cassette sub-family A member 3-like [Trichechus manatus latirostris]
MALEFRQFTLLLWKNFILKKRQWILLIMEFTLELLFTVILLIVRNSGSVKHLSALTFANQSVQSLPPYFLDASIRRDWELAYIPSNVEIVKDLIKMVQQTSLNNFTIHGFTSEEAFEEYIKHNHSSDRVMAAVVFNHDFAISKDLPLQVSYNLRFRYSLRNTPPAARLLVIPKEDYGWNTGHLFPIYPSSGPRNPLEDDGGAPGYIREGFLALQNAVDKAIIHYHANDSAQRLFNSIDVYTKRFPFPAFLIDNFLIFLGQIWPPMILLIFSLTVFTILRTVVQEKETKLKEYLLMMGLRSWQLWSATFITFFLTLLVTISLMTVSLFIKIVKLPIIRYSDPALVFSFLLFYGITTVLFAFMLTTFFNKANMAIAVGGFIYFVSYLPYFVISPHYVGMPFRGKLFSCLLSNVAMTFGINLLIKLESIEVGVQWRNLKKSFSLIDDFAFGHVMVMLLVDAFLYTIVIWYMEAVFPGDYGVPHPWYFFGKSSYWDEHTQSILTRRKKHLGVKKHDDEFFEPEPENLVASVQIKNLSKVFKVGSTYKEAVRDLTLNLYEGQITALLGHNGAGKTTILSLLSGLFPPTSGKAYICGFDISKDMFHIRKSLGLCPQNDLLFDYLTVSEHLYFFARLKGLPRDLCQSEINNILNVFKLQDKRHSFSNSLSGGMKRKLSISIALVGNSKVVMLDDPTSGMDLISRRATWDLLQQQKHGRTILLTTHYMDEVDLLGDRIAIMAKGNLQCCGSSLFLKQKYGTGYHMVMVKEPQCKATEVASLIYNYVPDAILESNVGAELSFILPKKCANRFEDLFRELENHQVSLGIASYAVSVTTMEEVFLRVNKLTDSTTDLQATQLPSEHDPKGIQPCLATLDDKPKGDFLMPEDLPNIRFNTGIILCIQQFYALLMKRALYTFRHWKTMLLQILILLFFTAFLLKAIFYYSEVKDAPILGMDLHQYGQSVVPYTMSVQTELTLRFTDHIKLILTNEKQLPHPVTGNLEEFLLKSKSCRERCIVAISLDVQKSKTIITALFNNHAYHAAPVALSLVNNVLFKLLAGPGASISVSNKPQPQTAKQARKQEFHEGSKGHDVAFSLFFGTAIVASSFSLLTTLNMRKTIMDSKVMGLENDYAKLNSKWISDLNLKDETVQVSDGSSLVPYDYDVTDEQDKVLECPPGNLSSLNSPLILKELLKIHFQWVPVVAVNRLTFAVQKGECFGLLGFNGAGTSSIFKMLTGDETITSGEVVFDNKNISKSIEKGANLYKMKRDSKSSISQMSLNILSVQPPTLGPLLPDAFLFQIHQQISYCPQYDPLLEHLTGYEMLALHARLWGVPEHYIPAYVKNILSALFLGAFADKLIKNFSSGTRRKLSTGIALLGRPDIIFLDKPSSGMDPVARRLLWDIVSRIRESSKAVVIISHSMEECEALCTRLAVMENGKFKCLGSPQYLKNKFGSGFTLLAKVKRNKSLIELQALKTFIKTTFPDSSLKHEYQRIVHYHIPSKDFTWSQVFGILESIKDEYGLEDYSISHNTLEQVFLSFAQTQIQKEQNYKDN